MNKTITVDGRELVICGRLGDPYFDHLNVGDHTNDFLLYVSRHFLRKDATILDIGANIGVTVAILATAAPRGHLFAFEPDAETHAHLLATIEANRLVHCQPHQIALGAISGEIDFLSNATSGSASHVAFEGISLGGSNTRAKMKTVDEFVLEQNLGRLDFIKIDVEGYEVDVLLGGRDTLARFKPHVFLEFNAFTLIAYGNQNPRHVLELLKRTFPHVYRFDGGSPHEITDQVSMLTFIHDNLIKRGCVDDLFCTFEAISPAPR